ncbi:hypothetical protein KSD_53450 [Ktedonobacter sp. SOSP1-85]|uniref:Mov34/MPN/PAD-1 family protein n=1 Tax=Ktedonobacter sp. SOSP1-85 TaxID=2778367 RepID=UPI00191659A9|nr:Mov34/MPN/PAD-1 family protein [Ktedonobacter sp. SOSP1-85]GHO77574.1 hypothetical protein KSD_53450 [Ktedonobacter sp. SOSP1-85]
MKKQQRSSHTHIILSQEAREEIYQDVHQRAHIEACGALLGIMDEEGNWCIEHAHPLANTANSPVYFEFDPQELLTVEMSYPGRLIGVYHSHPTGYAQASSTDSDNMRRVNAEQGIPWAWLIVCGPFNQAQELANEKLLGYFHYEREGLQRLEIIFQ